MKYKNTLILSLIILLLSLITGCHTKTEYEIPETDKLTLQNSEKNYALYMKTVTKVMCHKIMWCEKRRHRALPSKLRKQLSAENCMASMLRLPPILGDKLEANTSQELKLILAKNTPTIRKVAPKCYQRVLQASCKEYKGVSRHDADCLKLRELSEKYVHKK